MKSSPLSLSPKPLILCSGLLGHTTASAAVVINNLAPATQGFAASLSGPTAGFGIFGPFEDREIAFSFMTGPDPAIIQSLSISINLGDAFLSPIQADISTGPPVNGGQIPVTLGTAVPAAPTPTTQVITITAGSACTLDPSSIYWIHLTVPSGSAINAMNNSNAPVLAPGWSLGNTWARDPDFGGSWNEISSGPQARIALEVEMVPEPGSVTLVALGMGLLLRRIRAQRVRGA
jgi:hypothetical protein